MLAHKHEFNLKDREAHRAASPVSQYAHLFPRPGHARGHGYITACSHVSEPFLLARYKGRSESSLTVTSLLLLGALDAIRVDLLNRLEPR